MPGPYGVTATGFVVKPQADIETDLATAIRAVYGAGIPTGPNSIWGQLITIMAERMALLWQAGEDLYNSAFPESASGAGLDLVVALAGIARLPATYSKVQATVVFSGSPAPVGAVVLPAGSVASVVGSGAKFATVADVISDGASTTFSVQFVAQKSGPVEAPAGSLTVIETPVTNWASVTNPLDQKPIGTNIETDAALRVRFANSLRAQGDGAAAAIRARLLEITGVTDCFVYENASDGTDSNGLPPHSIECVVTGGDDLTIAQSIYNNKSGGIGTYGTTSRNDVAGADGLPKTIFYSRPAQQNVYVAISIKIDPSKFPANGDTQIAAAVGLIKYSPGQTVRAGAASILGAITQVPGVLEITGLPFIGLAPSPVSSADLVFTNHQQASMDSSRVTVTHV